jgi:hypothetical protein
MPRFVILEHDHPFLHWDLMLEPGNVLRTWRLAAAPAPGQCVAAEALGDHRRAYLDYEGPVSGNRGQVQRWDSGTYDGDLPEIFTAGQAVELRLHGQRLRGLALLLREDSERWSFHPLS